VQSYHILTRVLIELEPRNSSTQADHDDILYVKINGYQLNLLRYLTCVYFEAHVHQDSEVLFIAYTTELGATRMFLFHDSRLLI